MDLIQIKDLSFSYPTKKDTLKNININVEQGKFTCIVGENGSGKSTCLKLLASLMKPVKGSVKHSKDKKIAYVHQNPMVQFTEDTVLKELSQQREEKLETGNLKRNPLKTKKEEAKPQEPIEISDYAYELLDYFNIQKLINNHPYDCSGGEQQRIAFIKAILEQPDIMILDEPNKGLDPISNHLFAKKLRELNEAGTTIIMTSHDLTFVSQTVDRCIMVFDGELQIDTTPRKLFSSNKFYTTYVNRMVKKYLPNAITLTDVNKQWIL